MPYIVKMIKEGKSEGKFYISKNTEYIVIDEEVKTIVEILKDIKKKNEKSWTGRIIEKLEKGEKDVAIMTKIPAGENKYYVTKKEIINMIYACCVAKGLISYEEIINETIG